MGRQTTPLPFGKIVGDVALCLLAASPMIAVRMFNVQPKRQGFYCDDKSLDYPYLSNTVSADLLVYVSLLVPMLVVFAVESFRHLYQEAILFGQQLALPTFSLKGKSISPLLHISYYIIGHFFLGMFACLSLTDIGKFAMGRLRPHFFAVCKPNFTSLDCTAGYVEHYACHEGEDEVVIEARQSFPSGHSSMSVYAAGFIVLYLQARFIGPVLFLRPILQLLTLFAALFTCLSRVTDKWHHPTDVLGGAFIGLVTVYTTVVYVARLFKPRKLTLKNWDSVSQQLDDEYPYNMLFSDKKSVLSKSSEITIVNNSECYT